MVLLRSFFENYGNSEQVMADNFVVVGIAGFCRKPISLPATWPGVEDLEQGDNSFGMRVEI
jgi:hypothetical protein